MNYIDALIALFIAYFLFFGYRRGFIRQFLDLIMILLAFFLAFKFFVALGGFLAAVLRVPASFSNVVGFLIIWFMVEIVYYIFFIIFYERIPGELRDSKLNKYTGVIPAFLRALISLWVILGLILILPIPQSARADIGGSLFARPLIQSSPIVEKYVGNVFGSAIENTVNFLTIKPESNETINLGFKTTAVSVDVQSENKMLELVNKERTSDGLKPLVMDTKLQEIARSHCKDMFAKGYFAHKSLDGLTPFDRMDKAGIKYMLAGENLALAPDVDTAHKGLMNSPGHRANILTADFGRVGIGVIDGGKYGKMFAQEFTD